MSTVLSFLQGHPLEVWIVVSALLSLTYTRLEAYPRTQAALSFLAGFGLDLPTIQAAVKKIIGAKKAPPGDGPYRTASPPPPPAPPPPPPAKARVKAWARAHEPLLVVGFIMGTMGFCVIPACLSPAQQVQAVNDVASIAACVIAHENEPPAQIAATCGLPAAQDVINLLAQMDHRAATKYPACFAAKDAGTDR